MDAAAEFRQGGDYLTGFVSENKMGQLTFLLLCVLPAAMLFSESCASTTDMTLQEGAGGKDVVDAVLGKLREK